MEDHKHDSELIKLVILNNLDVLASHILKLMSESNYDLEQALLKAKISAINSKIYEVYGDTLESLRPRNNTAEKAEARHLAGYLLREHAGLGLARIGSLLSRTHSNILNSIKQVNNRMETDKEYNDFVTNIINTL